MPSSISTLELFRLFISFEDDSGSEAYRYLFYLFRIAYLIIEAKAFIPTVVEGKKSFMVAYKLLRSIPEVEGQLKLLSKLAPKMVQHKRKYLNQLSSTEAILSATISDFVPNIGFAHKKMKNNPPQISWSFFLIFSKPP